MQESDKTHDCRADMYFMPVMPDLE
ncbi:hypothetical protein CC1_11130 [Coprococcus catus GD/7]|uniref:Uncharacterized protein n=1 Tax=Coprococcus catus GD/7 TaxID=717962 RepID=D4J6G7_9FIRM|nr:hypothetical protein CC1_11130 [Coprococcus catus GD/7]